MKFQNAYVEMLKGNKIARPCFKGYWYIDGKDGDVVIHLANGTEIKEGNLSLTIQNTLAEDWDIVNDSDCCACECNKASYKLTQGAGEPVYCTESDVYKETELAVNYEDFKAQRKTCLTTTEDMEMEELKACDCCVVSRC